MNTDYEVLIYREEDYWVACVPQLIGCATHADTREAALRSLESLLPEWLELTKESGYPIPEPENRLANA